MGDGSARHSSALRGTEQYFVMTHQNKSKMYFICNKKMHLFFPFYFCRSVDNAIANFSRPFNDMNFQVIRPNGSQMKAIVHITLARILKATLVLKGLVIEWVIVKGYNEGGSTDSETDLWQESDYQVFRKITDNANAAMLNFSSPMYPEYGLKSFIVSVPFF